MAVATSRQQQRVAAVASRSIDTAGFGDVPLRAPAQRFECEGGVVALACSHLADAIVACSRTGRLSIWDAESGEKVRDVDCGPGVQALVCGPRVAITGSRNGQVISWDLGAGAQVREMSCGSAVEALVYMGEVGLDGSVAAGDDLGAISTWDLSSGWMTQLMRGLGAVQALAYGSGNILASGGTARRVSVWDCELGALRWEVMCKSHVLSVAISNTLGVVAAGELTGRIVVLDLATGTAKCTFEDHLPRSRFVEGCAVSCLVFVPMDDVLVSAQGGRITVWDLHAERKLRETHCAEGAQHLVYLDGLHVFVSGGATGAVLTWPWSALV